MTTIYYIITFFLTLLAFLLGRLQYTHRTFKELQIINHRLGLIFRRLDLDHKNDEQNPS